MQRRAFEAIAADQVRIGHAVVVRSDADGSETALAVTSVGRRRGWVELGLQGSARLAVPETDTVRVLAW